MVLFILLGWMLSTFGREVSAQEIDVAEIATTEIVAQEEFVHKEPKRFRFKELPKPEIITEEEEEPPLPVDAGPTFLLEDITLEGNEVYSDEDLAPFILPLVGQKVNFRDLRAMIQLITNHYRSNGYITSRAFLPPQRIEDGKVKIRVLEGKIKNVFVEGNRYFNDRSYHDVIPKGAEEAFRYQSLEQGITKLNRHPDRFVKAYLTRGLEPGTSDIILKTKERVPVSLYYEFHNRGSKFTHRARHILNFAHRSLLGFGDTFRASFPMAEEGTIRGFTVQYSLPLVRTNTTLSFYGSFVKSKLVKSLKTREIGGKSTSLGMGLNQSIIQGTRLNFDVAAGFDLKDSKIFVGENKISFDRMRGFRIGPRISLRHKKGKTSVSVDAHVGIPNFLGGSASVDSNASKFDSGGRYVYYTADIYHVQKLNFRSLLVLHARAQLSHHPLTSLEQFRGGGAFSVRGYPESDFSGDYGFLTSAELRVPPVFIPESWKIPIVKRSFRQSVRLIGFIDAAKIFIKKRADEATKKDKLLLGTGFGVSADLGNKFSVDFSLGFPFGESSNNNEGKQVHLAVRGGF